MTGLDSNTFKSRKVQAVIATVVLVVGSSWGFHGWLGGHLDVWFISEAEAQDLREQVSQAASTAQHAAETAQATSEALVRYMERQDIKEVREKVADLNGQLQETLLWESTNGENALSRARKQDLRTRIQSREMQFRCLEQGRSNCEF